MIDTAGRDPGSSETYDRKLSWRYARVLDHLDQGIVLLNEALTPVIVNEAARDLLGWPPGHVPPILAPAELGSIARRAASERDPTEGTVSLASDRKVVARAFPLDDGDVLLSVDDVTRERADHQLRRQFVANASHELKTPVAALRALAEAILTAIPEEPHAAEQFASKMVEETNRLTRLLENLLDLSRVEELLGGRADAVSVSEIVTAEVASAGVNAGAKGILVESRVQPELYAAGDAQQLRLLVSNLLDNAVRFTPPGGRVAVSLGLEGRDQIGLAVEDSGIGIPVHAQTRVFERFYRVDEARSRAQGGTGLGLAIVKNVAEVHGGRVTLESTLGEGSTFRVFLPLDR